MELTKIIETIESHIPNPSKGLPEEIFFFVSRITPLINVDLLIKNEHSHTLLTWRDDGYSLGWHVPGGIIRYKETIAERVKAVARNELGVEVEFDPMPLAMNEIMNTAKRTRGHFISLLYKCRLVTQPTESLRCKNNSPTPGEWMWHSSCPDDIISVHDKIYRKFI